MQQLLRLFIDIAFLKKGPQDVPYSPLLFAVLFILGFMLELLAIRLPDLEGKALSPFAALRFVVIANAVNIAAIYLIFLLQGQRRRFLQSMTTLTGLDLILLVLRLPIIFLMFIAARHESHGLLTLLFYAQMILLAWLLMIYMHTFRIALEIPGLYAGALSAAIFALNLLLNYLLLSGTT